MAGYDFSFEMPVRLREYARKWLRYIQRLSSNFELSVSYRTRAKTGGKAEVWVTVDGPLPAIQHLNRQSWETVVHFLRVVGKPRTLTRHLFGPYFKANNEAVSDITDLVFEVADDLGSKPAPLVVPPVLSRQLDSRIGESRESQSLQTLIRALDGWFSGALLPKDVMILCDQSMESWLKARLGLPSSSAQGFHRVVDLALQNELISRTDAHHLRRFHSARNRVQHGGGRARAETVLSMLDYYVQLVGTSE